MKILTSGDLLPVSRPADGHKGTFGRVLIIAGSVGMSGAAALAATGALRGGAGLVTVLCPAAVRSEIAGHNPCYTTVGMDCDDDGQIRPQDTDMIENLCARHDAIAVGPGLGQTSAVRNLVRAVMTSATRPLVLDADAINVTAKYQLLDQNEQHQSCVLTPHPGEFARLTGETVKQISASREISAARFATTHGITLVLKGSETVVTDGLQVYVNTTGNSGMATGGSGDVLTGILAAQLARGLPPIHASARAVYIHGLAADLAADEVSETGLIATDLLDYLGPAWLKFTTQQTNP